MLLNGQPPSAVGACHQLIDFTPASCSPSQGVAVMELLSTSVLEDRRCAIKHAVDCTNMHTATVHCQLGACHKSKAVACCWMHIQLCTQCMAFAECMACNKQFHHCMLMPSRVVLRFGICLWDVCVSLSTQLWLNFRLPRRWAGDCGCLSFRPMSRGNMEGITNAC